MVKKWSAHLSVERTGSLFGRGSANLLHEWLSTGLSKPKSHVSLWENIWLLTHYWKPLVIHLPIIMCSSYYSTFPIANVMVHLFFYKSRKHKSALTEQSYVCLLRNKSHLVQWDLLPDKYIKDCSIKYHPCKTLQIFWEGRCPYLAYSTWYTACFKPAIKSRYKWYQLPIINKLFTLDTIFLSKGNTYGFPLWFWGSTASNV